MRQEVLIITCDVCGDRIDGAEIPYAYIGTQQLDPNEPDLDDGISAMQGRRLDLPVHQVLFGKNE